jgi:hypothetical protein
MKTPKIGDKVAYVTGLSFEGIPILRDAEIVAIQNASSLTCDLCVGSLQARSVPYSRDRASPHSWCWYNAAAAAREAWQEKQRRAKLEI